MSRRVVRDRSSTSRDNDDYAAKWWEREEVVGCRDRGRWWWEVREEGWMMAVERRVPVERIRLSSSQWSSSFTLDLTKSTIFVLAGRLFADFVLLNAQIRSF